MLSLYFLNVSGFLSMESCDGKQTQTAVKKGKVKFPIFPGSTNIPALEFL